MIKKKKKKGERKECYPSIEVAGFDDKRNKKKQKGDQKSKRAVSARYSKKEAKVWKRLPARTMMF